MPEHMDRAQFKLVQNKLEQIQKHFPKLMHLDPPLGPELVRQFEASQGVSLPEDYRQMISYVAEGGSLPSFFVERYWRGLQYRNYRKEPLLRNPFPLTESCAPQGDEEWIATELPGQLPLVGNEEMSWSLITTGPRRGEVWLLGKYGALRAPACTFLQWLELVLDDNLSDYMAFCNSGEEQEENLPMMQRLFSWIRRGRTWTEDEGPKETCARWLERHRKPVPASVFQRAPKKPEYRYVGVRGDKGEYLERMLRMTLRDLPQESAAGLYELRVAQSKRKSRLRPEDFPAFPDTIQRFRGLLPGDRVCWEDEREMLRLGELIREFEQLNPEDFTAHTHAGLLYEEAGRLREKKEFTQSYAGLTELSFLQGLPKLRKLELSCNGLSDIQALSPLKDLKELTLSYNQITDLSPLKGMDKLCQLKLQGNQIRDLEPLRELHSLNHLNLRGNPLEPGALTALRKCRRLGMLDLTNTGIRDLRELEYCRAWNLDLYGNPQLEGLEVLPTMKNLNCLYLDTVVARRYDILSMMPRFSEFAELGGITVYIWPEKYYN